MRYPTACWMSKRSWARYRAVEEVAKNRCWNARDRFRKIQNQDWGPEAGPVTRLIPDEDGLVPEQVSRAERLRKPKEALPLKVINTIRRAMSPKARTVTEEHLEIPGWDVGGLRVPVRTFEIFDHKRG